MAHIGSGFFEHMDFLGAMVGRDPNTFPFLHKRPQHPIVSDEMITKAGGYTPDGSYQNVFDSIRTYAEKDSLLEYKSRLYIRFPKSHEGGRPMQVVIPFYEDPIIKERKRSRFATHSPIGRSSNLYTYLGSDSREFDISFGLTLPHLIQMTANNISRTSLGIEDVTSMAMQGRFFDGVEDGVMSNPEISQTPGGSPKSSNYYNKWVGNWLGAIQLAQGHLDDNQNIMKGNMNPGPQFTPPPNSAGGAIPNSSYSTAAKLLAAQGSQTKVDEVLHLFNDVLLSNKKGLPLSKKGLVLYLAQKNGIHYKNVQYIMDLITYWVEVIRATTYTDTFNPVMGPPIVVIEHGILYRKIPCITESYSIEFDPRAGYERDTLLPRKLLINLTLKENRSGDFGTFDSGAVHAIKGNNLAGYEVLFDGTKGGSLDLLPEGHNRL